MSEEPPSPTPLRVVHAAGAGGAAEVLSAGGRDGSPAEFPRARWRPHVQLLQRGEGEKNSNAAPAVVSFLKVYPLNFPFSFFFSFSCFR